MNKIVKKGVSDFFTKYNIESQPRAKSTLFSFSEEEKTEGIVEHIQPVSKIIVLDSKSSNSKLSKLIQPNKSSGKEDIDSDSFQEKTLEFINLIRSDYFESGYSSKSEQFFISQFSKNDVATKQWLSELFLDYLKEDKIVNGILHIISHMDYEDIYPEGQYIAMGVTSHKNIEIRESALRAFENWGSKDSLKILKNLSFAEQWLQDYLEEIISDLEEE